MNPGAFIVLEGPDGAGKTTQARLLADALREQGHDVVLTREPGGTPFAEDLRGLLKKHDALSDTTRLLAQYAARADHVEKVIIPAMREGKVVVCDRYTLSSAIYQCVAGNAPAMLAKDLAAFVAAASGAIPDVVFVLDAPDEAMGRNINPDGDAMEAKSREFHAAVRKAYRDVVKRENANRFEPVWSWDDPYAVNVRILATVEDVIRQKQAHFA